MTSLPQPPAWSHRLADQLQVLSEVAESLTYRLLEFEERLAVQEQQLLEQAETADPQQVEEMELRLLETEERLARIEALLGSSEAAGTGRHVQPLRLASSPAQALAGAASARPVAAARPDEEEILQEDPFLDEGEQPFMDELTA